MKSFIETFSEQYKDLVNNLLDQNELSLKIFAEEHFRKNLLLSCASFHEKEIQRIIIRFVETKSNSNDKIINFVQNKAIKRQYHTYFDWENRKANCFFGLFGAEFKEKIQKDIKENEEIKKAMEDFLSIGDERNKMAHCNFLDYKLEKTFKEIIELNTSALKFLVFMEQQLS